MLNTAIEAIRNTWDTFLGKIVLIVLVVGWMPFAVLSMAQGALAR